MAGKPIGNRRSGTALSRPKVLRRTLASHVLAQDTGFLLLDTVLADDGRIRLVLGGGMPASAFAPDGAAGCALPQELRDISGGALVVTADGPQGQLALQDGSKLAFVATAAETDLFAGLNASFGFRWDETAEQVAEGLVYHALFHGLQGALIINRAPAQGDGFARRLETALADCPILVVVLDCPLPLGKPQMAAENTAYLAPDAPGRDRMARPADDPWRAPLAESGIYEVAKWRFLAKARAVLTLDVSDILHPQAENAFDACLNAAAGVMQLEGRRIYPWRLRANHAASFADHICHAFDAGRGVTRWGVAPEKAGLENTWRQMRVSYARPEAETRLPFIRAMAIRIPGKATAVLAPKTALIEDPDLLKFAQDTLGGDPIRPPKSRTKPVSAHDPATNRTAIVTTMKNEGPFILEWLAYHRMIGVEDFLIYTNDCTDGTDALLDLLQAKGLVQHRDNPYRTSGLKPQHAALQAAEDEPVMQNCGWGICMDVDEFINIKIGDGTLGPLYAAMADANMISLTWRLFGNADVHGYTDDFLIRQFDRCAPEVIRKPHQAWGFKTLFRNIDIYKKLGVHRPKGMRPDLWDRVQWLNGSGRSMPKEMFRNGWRSTLETYGYDWVSLNHYAVRSAESFLVKRDRGRVNHVDRDQGLNYWFRMNHNVEQDRSIQRMIPRLQVEYDRLLADPEIRAAHAYCVDRHRSRIAELRATRVQAAFYDELTSDRMQRLCRLQPHFGSAVFMAGPQVIPDHVLSQPLPPDFFFTVPIDVSAEAEAE